MFDRLRNGYIAEELFILKCLEYDIPISRPVFNVEPYDFVIESHGTLLRVQVKKAWISTRGRHVVSIVGTHPRSKVKNKATKNDRVDIFAIWDDPSWYLIPRFAIEHIESQFCVSSSGSYSKYKDVFLKFSPADQSDLRL